jgi:two-component system, LuxR family, response regulator FixJ
MVSSLAKDQATVFVVEDDTAARGTLAKLVESIGLQAETYASAEEFLEDFDGGRAGCLLLDVRLHGMSGLQLQRELKARNADLPVIILTGYGDVTTAVKAMESGAVTFLEKPYNPQTLIDRVQEAIRLDADRRQLQEKVDGVKKRADLLTPRERQVMGLVVEGQPNKAIAARLGLSKKTVDTHRQRLMDKMAAGSLAELVRMVLLLESDGKKP